VLQSQLQGDLFHLQLAGEVDDEQFPDEDAHARENAEDKLMKDAEESNAETRGRQGLNEPSSDALENPLYDFEKQTWSLRFSDLPEVAGRRPVASRMISSVDIIDGNAIEFMDALGYKLVSFGSPLKLQTEHLIGTSQSTSLRDIELYTTT